MIRPSNGFVIFKKDLENGLVKRKRFNSKDKSFIEFWIYKAKEGQLYLPNGEKNVDMSNKTLKCIIVCDEGYIVKEGKDGLLIRGIKFTEEDIDKYLHKTNRSRA